MLMIIADRFCFTFIETLKKTNADDNCRFSFTFIKSFLVTQTHIGVSLSNWIPGHLAELSCSLKSVVYLGYKMCLFISFYCATTAPKNINFFFGGDGERSADQVIPDLAALRELERTKPQVCGQEKCSIFPLDRGIHLGNCMEW